MRVSLFYNPSAGTGDHDVELLLKALRRHGHEVDCFSMKDEGWKSILHELPHLAVVAGGDGAFGRAASQRLNTGAHLALLPMGTANNVAHLIGGMREIDALIEHFPHAKPIDFDLGMASGSHLKKKVFVESVGLGFFASAIKHIDSQKKTAKINREEKLKSDRKQMGEMLARYPGKFVHIKADGRDLSGRFLLVEALNVSQIGPRLRIVDEVRYSDNHFDLVLVEEGDRETLARFLEGRAQIKSLRVEKLEFEWADNDAHLDGKLLSPPPVGFKGPQHLTLTQAGSIKLLTGPDFRDGATL